jgi:hypothetical protein
MYIMLVLPYLSDSAGTDMFMIVFANIFSWSCRFFSITKASNAPGHTTTVSNSAKRDFGSVNHFSLRNPLLDERLSRKCLAVSCNQAGFRHYKELSQVCWHEICYRFAGHVTP